MIERIKLTNGQAKQDSPKRLKQMLWLTYETFCERYEIQCTEKNLRNDENLNTDIDSYF